MTGDDYGSLMMTGMTGMTRDDWDDKGSLGMTRMNGMTRDD